MKRIIIAGSRDFNNYDIVKRILKKYIKVNKIELSNIIIVSGCANGADKLGERFAIEYKIKLKKFPANWNEYGKSAGYIRNSEMAKYGNKLFAFWDGKSKGTKHMINLMKKEKKKVFIIK